jgi:hypothetical protein
VGNVTALAVIAAVVALAWAAARWGCTHQHVVAGRYVREVPGSAAHGYRDDGRRLTEPRFGLFCARCGALVDDGGPVR